MNHRAMLLARAVVPALGLVVLVSGCGSSSTGATPTPKPVSVQVGNPSKAVTLGESGSSLMLPYLQKLVDPIKAQYPNITLAPAGGGSGKGISDAISGTVTMGGSDAYMSDAQAAQNPTMLNIPVAISSQAVFYNVAGVSNLKLSGDVIAKIYEGHITTWNDPAIASLNSGVTLPATTIVPVRRVESSGDTFIFTSLLSATNSEWTNGPAFGTTVQWPAARGELTASGNPGMVQVCQQNPGCIAYIGISAKAAALAANLGEAMLQNKAGNFVQPTPDTIAAAVAAKATSIPTDLRASLIYADGAQSYPIVNYEYLIVNSHQTDADTALGVRSFLAWTIDPTGGSSEDKLSAVNFIALPNNVVQKVRAKIGSISA